MLPSTQITWKISDLKRLPDTSLTDLYSSAADDEVPTYSKLPRTEKNSSLAEARLYCTESLDSLDEDEPSISFAKPKVPSPKKSPSRIKRDQYCLGDDEQIIAWIVTNKRFLVAGFKGQLDEWVKKKLVIDPSFISSEKILKEFNDDFHSVMQTEGMVDVRKLNPDTRHEREDLFPDVYVCFIDAVNGLTDDSGWRATEILSNVNNNVLRTFLLTNKLIAECLASGLPTLNKVAELWAKENPVVSLESSVLSPIKPRLKVPPLSPGKSPNKISPPKKETSASQLANIPVNTSIPNLLANSMNSFLAHVNSNGALREPISPPGSPIKVKRPPVPAPIEPGMNRKQRVYRQLTYPKNG